MPKEKYADFFTILILLLAIIFLPAPAVKMANKTTDLNTNRTGFKSTAGLYSSDLYLGNRVVTWGIIKF